MKFICITEVYYKFLVENYGALLIIHRATQKKKKIRKFPDNGSVWLRRFFFVVNSILPVQLYLYTKRSLWI